MGEAARPSAEETVVLVRRWLDAADHVHTDPASDRLAAMLEEPGGLRFAVRFIDAVIRPEDEATAARAFERLAGEMPDFVPRRLRAAAAVGGQAAPHVPRLAVPLIRRTLRGMVSHLVADASDRRLGHRVARLRRRGFDLNLNLLGEAVLGRKEADRRLTGVERLLARADVDDVSVKVSAVLAPHSPWAFDEELARVAERLTPLFLQAAQAPRPKFINVDMEEYRDLDLTVAVFTRVLDDPRLIDLRAGIALQTYLPDAFGALARIERWAAERRERGGSPVNVRLVKGANLPMERVEAQLRCWPQAPWEEKVDTDAHYKRLLDYALTRERVDAVRIGVAGHNLFDVAHAWLLAGARGVREGIVMEMLLGMAPGQAEAVRRDVGRLLLYTPVVHTGEFDVAISYLVRRLDEGAEAQNYMSAIGRLDDPDVFAREQERFEASLRRLEGVPDPIPTRRTQDRIARRSAPQRAGESFRNTPDTDPSIAANRAWARRILTRSADSALGVAAAREHAVPDAATMDSLLADAADEGRRWAARPAAERAGLLRRAADVIEGRRADLIEVMVAEAGKTISEADPEVSEAADFARHYADHVVGLESQPGARFVPAGMTVIAPPWNFPVAIPAGGTLAALAAGSAVVLKPAPQAPRCAEVLAAALWEAGVPRAVLRVAHVDEDALGERLMTDPHVGRVILTGAYDTAVKLRSMRPELPLLAETSGKNAIVVTASADMDLAARDVAHSAFSHAGQKCSAASLVILVGAAARSRRFRSQLVDAVTALRVGWPDDPETQVGPLIAPADGKLLDALTRLDPGERWLVEPQRRDDAGRLWAPGVKEGVVRGSRAHRTEFFGPVLSVMTAATLDEAIAVQNDVEYGLTAGLHSLDRDEIARWLGEVEGCEGVEAGNLYVNKSVTGAIVRRQPFGGWKRSSVGTGCKVGGPNYLLALGDWQRVPDPDGAAGRGANPAWLKRALADDAAVWSGGFGVRRDAAGLGVERNVFRYRPTEVHVRLSERAPVLALVRVLAAADRVGAPVTVSAGDGSAGGVSMAARDDVREVLEAAGRDASARVSMRVRCDDDWLAWATRTRPERIRLIEGRHGGMAAELARRIDGDPAVAIYAQPVTASGRLEQLPFLREQSVSITAHRFGTPDRLTDGLLA